jgi:hypothetical protein
MEQLVCIIWWSYWPTWILYQDYRVYIYRYNGMFTDTTVWIPVCVGIGILFLNLFGRVADTDSDPAGSDFPFKKWIEIRRFCRANLFVFLLYQSFIFLWKWVGWKISMFRGRCRLIKSWILSFFLEAYRTRYRYAKWKFSFNPSINSQWLAVLLVFFLLRGGGEGIKLWSVILKNYYYSFTGA